MAFNFEYPYTDPNRHNDDWAINKIKELLKAIAEHTEWIAHHKDQYEELKQLYDDVMAGDFPESITNAFHDWMKENANELVGSMVHNVFFGLTDTGYFAAYIPESWSDIQFGTIEDGELYGHLVLSYD